jgi:tRNA splicing endonuclease
MASSEMLRRVALVRTDVSEEPSASFIEVTRIGELGTIQAATSNRRKLRYDTILHSHRRENLKSYILYKLIRSAGGKTLH